MFWTYPYANTRCTEALSLSLSVGVNYRSGMMSRDGLPNAQKRDSHVIRSHTSHGDGAIMIDHPLIALIAPAINDRRWILFPTYSMLPCWKPRAVSKIRNL